MATLHVRDVPAETMAALKRRAGQAGQSMQAFICEILNREATVLSPQEVAERARQIAERSSVTTEDVLDAIEASRRRGD